MHIGITLELDEDPSSEMLAKRMLYVFFALEPDENACVVPI